MRGGTVRVAIFGLGYVGSVTAACLAHDGHRVFGVDSNTTKVTLLNNGQSPIVEEGMASMIADAVDAGRLTGTDDAAEAVAASDLALVCVGTPSLKNGSIDLSHVRQVIQEIGAALRDRTEPFTVVVRSTVLPGTTRHVVLPLLESRSGKKVGADVDVCFVPEFLREGSAVADYFDPPKTVIGTLEGHAPRAILDLFDGFDAPLIIADLETAELTKYVDNAWHALKVAFANEVGRVARAVGVDGRRVMDLFTEDTKLNISAKYLKPGQAFGGSCLPKDLRALTHHAQGLDLDVPVLASALRSNAAHRQTAFELVTDTGAKRIGLLGLSFKGGTDDVRESPMMDLAERLIGKGYDVRIHDPFVSLSSLLGTNREFLFEQIPHIRGLLVDSIEDIVEHAETIVVGTGHAQFKDALTMRKEGQTVIDLVGIVDGDHRPGEYRGICW